MIGALLKQEIESIFRVVPDKCKGDEVVIICPECCDRSGHRSISLKTGQTFCFRCNKGVNNKGYFLAWARALGYHFTSDSDQSNAPVEEVLYGQEEGSSTVPIIEKVDLPKGFTPISSDPKSVYTRLITDMARRKNLDYEDFVAARVGFTRNDPRWEPFAIFPVYDYGIPVYYQGRTYVDVPGETTKRFPSKGQVKWGASYWVYNIDAVRELKPEVVIVVESILNVLSLRWKLLELRWDSFVPVCVFKHHISKVQALKILRCRGIKEVCLLFDHDAIDATWNSITYLGNRLKVTVAEMPIKGQNEKLDPNDDVELAVQSIQDRKLYTSGNAIKRLLDKGFDAKARESVFLGDRELKFSS